MTVIVNNMRYTLGEELKAIPMDETPFFDETGTALCRLQVVTVRENTPEEYNLVETQVWDSANERWVDQAISGTGSCRKAVAEECLLGWLS